MGPAADADILVDMLVNRIMDVVDLVRESEEFYACCSSAVEGVMSTKSKKKKER